MKYLHLKELLKLIVKTLKNESQLKEINLIITPAELRVLSKLRNKAQSIKSSNNKTGNNAKSISLRARKILIAMSKLEPNYAQQLREIEK